jgi:hypothetical protein
MAEVAAAPFAASLFCIGLQISPHQHRLPPAISSNAIPGIRNAVGASAGRHKPEDTLLSISLYAAYSARQRMVLCFLSLA